MSDKAPDAYRTISEVGEDLDLPQHVLRFWETRFTQIRPLKRGGGRRYYRPDDVDLLRGIKHLLYGQGYTIKGVQRILKSQGLKFVQTVWRDPGSLSAAGEMARQFDDEDANDEAADVEDTPGGVDQGPELPAEPTLRSPEPSINAPPPFVAAPAPPPPMRMETIPAPSRLVLRPALDDDQAAMPAVSRLSREDTHRLRAALYELMEAKRRIEDLG